MRRNYSRIRRLWPVVIFLFCVWYFVFPSPFHSFSFTRPANSTLGFGAIYAVSGPGSSRRSHLIQAANVTEIDLVIPEQHRWSDEQVKEFRDAGTEEIGVGSVYAWLAHNLVLKEFLESGFETALILEDDVDWDIHLRTSQISAAASAFRSLNPSSIGAYYGDNWDLLYLGHCGDYFDSVTDNPVGVGHLSPRDLTSIPHKLYADPTLLPRWNLHPFTASFLTSLNVPEKTRFVHRSVVPLCTFAYAVTRQAAKVLIEDVAPPKANAMAYDVAILHGCRNGWLRCWSLNPELFHHVEGESIIGTESAHGFKPPVDAAGFEQVIKRQETSNIGCGFWRRDLDFEDDPKKLAYLRKEIKQGRCLKSRGS